MTKNSPFTRNPGIDDELAVVDEFAIHEELRRGWIRGMSKNWGIDDELGVDDDTGINDDLR